MPKPIAQLVNRFGPKPPMITTGSVSLGIIAFSTASLGVGVLTLLSMGNVLPGALTSLQSLGLAGGIAFTAVGSVGVLGSSGCFILIAICVRSALKKIGHRVAKLQEPRDMENEGIDENLFSAYQQIVDDLKNFRPYESPFKEFCYIKFWEDDEKFFLSPNVLEIGTTLRIGYEGSQHMFTMKKYTAVEFTQRLMLHLQAAYPDIEIKVTDNHKALLIKFNQEEENA